MAVRSVQPGCAVRRSRPAAKRARAVERGLTSVFAPSDASCRRFVKTSRCKRCSYPSNADHRVGEGNPCESRLIGKAGAEEDATGRRSLDAPAIARQDHRRIGLKREDVYIANVVKCRPPGIAPPSEMRSTCASSSSSGSLRLSSQRSSLRSALRLFRPYEDRGRSREREVNARLNGVG